MDRLDSIRVFVRVVERGSFSAVAREMSIGQPAVSKQIAALEEHLGTQLVRRTSRSLSITPAGADFYDTAVRLVGELETAMSRASRGGGHRAPSGVVRVTTAAVFGRLFITQRLGELLDRFPRISVELLISDRTLDLVAEGIDLALRHGELPDSSLVARPLGTSPLLTLASMGYLERRGIPRSPADLDRHECLLRLRRGTPRAWRYRFPADGADGTDGDGEKRAAGVRSWHAEGRFRTNDAEQIRAAVLGDIGLTQAPGWLFARELASGQVRAVLREYEPEPVAITAVWPGGRRPANAVRAVLDFFAEGFAREPMLNARLLR